MTLHVMSFCSLNTVTDSSGVARGQIFNIEIQIPLYYKGIYIDWYEFNVREITTAWSARGSINVRGCHPTIDFYNLKRFFCCIKSQKVAELWVTVLMMP